MIILIKEYSDQKIIQQHLFSLGYSWYKLTNKIKIVEYEYNLYYLLREDTKKFTFIKDINDLDFYIEKVNCGISPIDSKTFLREEKLKRILYDNTY